MKVRIGDKVFLTDGARAYLVTVQNHRTLHTDLGALAIGDLIGKSYGDAIKLKKGELFILEPTQLDLLLNAKRGPAVVLPKDFGAIVAYTGIGKESLCLDAGSGSGWLACQLGRVAKKVVTYENRIEHFEVAKANIEALGLNNVEIKNRDAAAGFDETNADLITLDMLNPEKVPFASSLRVGGYCVAYLPHLEQAEQFIDSLKRSSLSDKSEIRALPAGLFVERVLDVRAKELDGNLKPARTKINHTAWMVFVRKLIS